MHPPLKNPDEDKFNYEFHYREVLISPDGKSFADNPNAKKANRDMAAGQIIMDMADGYEISYDYYIKGLSSTREDAEVIEGKTITPYFRAVLLNDATGGDKEYVYISNEPEETPVIPDFPKDYISPKAYLKIKESIGGNAVWSSHNTYPSMAQKYKCPMWQLSYTKSDQGKLIKIFKRFDK